MKEYLIRCALNDLFSCRPLDPSNPWDAFLLKCRDDIDEIVLNDFNRICAEISGR